MLRQNFAGCCQQTFRFGSADPKQNMIAEWAQISLRYLYEEAIPLNGNGKIFLEKVWDSRQILLSKGS